MKYESKNLLYRSATVYKLIMRMLYGQHYGTRCAKIAELIPAQSTVLDLCCGPAVLYHQYLCQKAVDYTGVDGSAQFVNALIKEGIPAILCDLRGDMPLPHADYVVMQASLYHFLPNVSRMLDRMLQTATKQVIVAEPIRNLATSEIPILSTLAARLSGPVQESSAHRFTEESLDRLFQNYSDRVIHSFKIAGGREKVYVLETSAA